MPPSNKRRGRGTTAATLPLELVVQIAARSDAATLFCCAAACKRLRREILNPAFVRRVRDAGVLLPSRLLGFIHEPRSFSLVHPNTPAAASFAEDCLAPFVSRSLDGGFFLEVYRPVTSRGGLVLLERPYSHWRRSISEGPRPPDICVYDLMTGVRAFLPFPPDIVGRRLHHHEHAYVLLTAADGVGCSFLVLAADIDGFHDFLRREQCFTVQAASSDAGSDWVPTAGAMAPGHALVRRNDGAVVLGGVVHWLVIGIDGHAVLTYDAAGTKTVGVIKLPKDPGFYCGDLHLGSSPDGKLSVFAARGFALSFWVRSDGAWAQQAEVDTAPILRPLLEEWELEDEAGNGFYQWLQGVKVKGIGDKRSRVVLLRLPDLRLGRRDIFVLDMETKKIRRIVGNKVSGIPYELDIYSRLSTMRTF